MNISRMKTNLFLYLLAVLGLAGLVACAAPPAAESQGEAFADEANEGDDVSVVVIKVD